MKKLFILFLLFFISPVMALYNSTISNGCDNNVLYPNTTTNRSRMIAVFQPHSHTCNSGYFLPANVDGCRACPNGYTCSGGTFDFNPTQSQGINHKTIMTNNISNGCSDNLLVANDNKKTKMIAIFRPKTVSLTWDDGNGNTTTGTCDYGGELTLPVEPTRVGYTFSGWRVKTNNN